MKIRGSPALMCPCVCHTWQLSPDSRKQIVVNTWHFTTFLPCHYLHSYISCDMFDTELSYSVTCKIILTCLCNNNGADNPFYAQYCVIQGFCQNSRDFVCLVKGNQVLKLGSMLVYSVEQNKTDKWKMGDILSLVFHTPTHK